MDSMVQPLIAIAQVVMIDVALAGDNAIVVGIAASRVPAGVRRKVIFWGIAGAVVLRVLFAVIATQLFAIIGLTLAGGILLLWVCWKMYRELRRGCDDEGSSRVVRAGMRGRDRWASGAPSLRSSSRIFPCHSTTCWRSRGRPRTMCRSWSPDSPCPFYLWRSRQISLPNFSCAMPGSAGS